MKRTGLIILSLVLLLTHKQTNAQEISEVYVTSDTLQVYFRQSKIDFVATFRDNGKRLNEFSQRFKALLDCKANKVRSILIVSGASPEGSYHFNRYLSDNRAKVVYDYLINNNLADSAEIEIESRGVDWVGLASRVAVSNLPYKEEVLDIIKLPDWITKNGTVVDGRKHRLMNLNGGNAWNELYKLYFADLRGTRVMIAYNIRKEENTITTAKSRPIYPSDSIKFIPLIPPRIPFSEVYPIGNIAITKPYELQVTKPKRNFYLAVETNLLYDASVIPNYGAEIGFWKGLTISGNYQNIWLRNGNRTCWYRVEGFELGLNWYINNGNRPFKGHHVGIFGQMLTWDITINHRGYLAERWSFGGSLTYGYALPIGKRFNLDFEIGIGYLSGNMHEYIPQDGHRVWQSYGPFNWFGPTKLGITLQWLIGRGNYNERRANRI